MKLCSLLVLLLVEASLDHCTCSKTMFSTYPILQVAGVGKDVWSMGSKLSNSIFKPKKVETETTASTPCEATTSHQVPTWFH